MARHVAACIVAVLLASACASAASGVNVVQAFNLGCSGDRLTDADMRVTILVDGQVAARTVKAQDVRNPLYAFFHPLPQGERAQLTFLVEEAEPGGFLGLGTTWEECDVSPGEGTRHTVTWDGSHRQFTLRGDGSRGAELDVTVGSDAPSAPRASVTDVRPTGGRLLWDAGGEGHKVAWAGAGRVIAEYGGGAGSHTFDGLCEGTSYWLRVVRVQGDWQVGSEDIVLQTTNLPPLPPQVVEASLAGETVHVRVHLPTHHDLAALELHATDAAGRAAEATLVERFESSSWSPEETRAATWPGASHAVVVAEDRAGLRAVSDPFRVDSPPSQAAPPAAAACLHGGGAAPQDAGTSPAVRQNADGGVLWGRAVLMFAAGAAALVVALIVVAVALSRK